MTKSSKIFIFYFLGIVLLLLGLYYFGFVYSFRNFSGGGSGYPLAVYAIPANVQKSTDLLDSVAMADSFIARKEFSYRDGTVGYKVLLSDFPKDSVSYEIELRSSLTNTDTTELIIWSIVNKTDSITPHSLKQSNRKNIDQMKTRFEIFVLRKLAL